MVELTYIEVEFEETPYTNRIFIFYWIGFSIGGPHCRILLLPLKQEWAGLVTAALTRLFVSHVTVRYGGPGCIKIRATWVPHWWALLSNATSDAPNANKRESRVLISPFTGPWQTFFTLKFPISYACKSIQCFEFAQVWPMTWPHHWKNNKNGKDHNIQLPNILVVSCELWNIAENFNFWFCNFIVKLW